MKWQAHLLTFVSLLLLPAACTHAQDPFPNPLLPLGIIDTVTVNGNEVTRLYVILNEMTLRKGSTVTRIAMDFDRNRIYSLGLFTSVDVTFDSTASLRVLRVVVSERWYIFPVPIVGFRDGDTKRPYYGAGIMHTNFNGRNQKVFASAVFGYDPSLALSFMDPLFNSTHALSLSASLGFSRVRNKSQFDAATGGAFDEEHYDLGFSVGKRFTLYEMAGVSAGYHIISVSHFLPKRTRSKDGTDRYAYMSMQWAYDSRDLAFYPSAGKYLSISATKQGLVDAEIDMFRLAADLRGYVPLPLDVTLAMRSYASLVSGGLVPSYAHAYFGYGERIRGYYSTVLEGENMAGATVELRFPLLQPQTFYPRFLPLPPEFSVWRFAISFALFADAGTIWYRGDPVSLRSGIAGYGAGLHIQLPYDILFRTEFAINDRGRNELIFDFRRSI